MLHLTAKSRFNFGSAPHCCLHCLAHTHCIMRSDRGRCSAGRMLRVPPPDVRGSAGRNSIVTFVTWNDTVKVNRGQRSRCIFINWTMVNIFVSGTPGLRATVEMICATFTFVTWKNPLKVNRGQRSRCNFINWAMVNIFVYRHPGPGATVEMICATFTFVTWKNPLKVNRGQRSRCAFINWAIVNIFVYMHPGLRSNR